MSNNIKYYLGFSHCFGIGPMRFKALLSHLGSVREAYEVPKSKLEQLLGIKVADRFVAFRANFDPVKKLEELKNKNIQVVTQEDKFYPDSLKQLSDSPICLYLKGDIKLLNSPYFFAIVGTRRPTGYGQQITKIFASDLALAGFIIVSGMAMGIDAVAHQAALNAGGKTMAVLGCGVDIIYPAVNTKLYQQIIEKGGAIISEFPPGHTVLRGLFISRNRIISGLSRGVLVIEGLKDSGALITARFAAEQGKEVFAPPAPITSELSEAPNLLLKQGAKLVTSVEDIISELGLQIIPNKKEEVREKLNDREKIVFDFLQKEPMLVDNIALKTNQSIEEILNIISLLEIKGVVEKGSDGKYQIRL